MPAAVSVVSQSLLHDLLQETYPALEPSSSVPSNIQPAQNTLLHTSHHQKIKAIIASPQSNLRRAHRKGAIGSDDSHVQD